jgi:hypothetical protein
VALGSGVSLLVGVLFWPRGAALTLRETLADAYVESARYLARAVEFATRRCDSATPAAVAPAGEAAAAAAASRRLDDAFRAYLGERGAKPVPLAEVTSLLTGVVGLRLAGDAVLDLWRSDGAAEGDRRAASRELTASAKEMSDWYGSFAQSLLGRAQVPEPLPPDHLANQRLVDAVGHDLRSPDGTATETGIRMIWTSDHVDAARRLQGLLVEPARAAAEARKN